MKFKNKIKKLDKIAIGVKAHKVLLQLLKENPDIEKIMRGASSKDEALAGMRRWIMNYFDKNPKSFQFYRGENKDRTSYEALDWSDLGAIRLKDYIDYAGRQFEDLNHGGEIIGSNPIKYLWLAIKKGRGGANYYFFLDMLHLFRQIKSRYKHVRPPKERVLEWMDRHPSGLDEAIINVREENKDRIIRILIEKIDLGEIRTQRYTFDPELTEEQKYIKMQEWWEDKHFHLKFAIRHPQLLNELLDGSLSLSTMKTLNRAKAAGIPFFINPYYLSLLNVREPEGALGSDLAIRDYVLYSEQLIDEYGSISAWEKEDLVQPGVPNAAGWILPSSHNLHRRYPEVAIMIPDTAGRTCGGLCVSCQRMYDFQSGHLNFNIEKLEPSESWPQKLRRLMYYFEEDSQLRDILITGGDALMSSDNSLKTILEAVYDMALRKKENNKELPEGKKMAEILRVRLGTRLPVYLPQRITQNLIEIISNFKEKAEQIGIRQFVIQTHFESAMEITPEVKKGLENLQSAGWIITNQMVFTTAASRRGHAAKLRKVLNDLGVITYYTFSVKGFMENWHNFATNERAVQEQIEEKYIGEIDSKYYDSIQHFADHPENLPEQIHELRKKLEVPFLATDRNVMNLPGVGKSLTFRTIGIDRSGRRILEFDHDQNRNHSPIISKMGKVIIIESKAVGAYLEQIEEMGEDMDEYKDIWGYSLGETEPRVPIFDYPEYEYQLTSEVTNFSMDDFYQED